jgi:DNA polymerase (family X)
MDKHLAALVLDEIASLLALQDADRFRVLAYRNAARAVDRLEGDLAGRLVAGELGDIPGLGPGTVAVLRELVETGRSRLYDRLRQETPAGLAQLRTVPGLGPKRIRTLHERLGIESVQALREAAIAGRVATLPGFGPATQKRVLEGLDFVDQSAGRRRQPQAYATADRLIGHLETMPVHAVYLAGELRRRCETVNGIDLLVVTDDPDPVIEGFLALPGSPWPSTWTGPGPGRAWPMAPGCGSGVWPRAPPRPRWWSRRGPALTCAPWPTGPPAEVCAWTGTGSGVTTCPRGRRVRGGPLPGARPGLDPARAAGRVG